MSSAAVVTGALRVKTDFFDVAHVNLRLRCQYSVSILIDNLICQTALGKYDRLYVMT